jgi:hypothetical protein
MGCYMCGFMNMNENQESREKERDEQKKAEENVTVLAI